MQGSRSCDVISKASALSSDTQPCPAGPGSRALFTEPGRGQGRRNQPGLLRLGSGGGRPRGCSRPHPHHVRPGRSYHLWGPRPGAPAPRPQCVLCQPTNQPTGQVSRTVALRLHFAIPAPSTKPRVGDKSCPSPPSRIGRGKTRPGLQNPPGHARRAGAFQHRSPGGGGERHLPAATQPDPKGPSSARRPSAPAAGPAPRPPRPLPLRKKKIGGGQWEAGKAPDVREPAGGVAWRPRRGQRSVPSPGPPAPPPPRGQALYRARARGPRSSSSPRAAVGSARGAGRAGQGRAGHGAPESALRFFPFPLRSRSRAPLPRPRRFPRSSLAPQQTFGPSPPLARYSSWLEPGRAAPRAPPNLPAGRSDHYRTQKHVDHTSVGLLRHRLLVQDGEIPGQPQSEHHAGQEGGGHARGRRPQLGLRAGLPPTALGQQPARAGAPRARPRRLLAQVPGRRRGGRRGPLRPAQGARGGRRRRRRGAAGQGEQVPGPLVQRERRAQPAPPAPAAAAAEGGRRLADQLHALQDGAVPALRGERHVQVRREVPVRARLPRAAQPHAPPQVQDRAVPHLPHHRLLPLRAALPLHPQRGRAAARARRARLRGPARPGRPRRAAAGLRARAAAQAAPQPQLLGLPVGPPPAGRPGGAAARQPHLAHAAAALLLGLVLLLVRLLLLLRLGRLHALGRPDVLRLGGGGGGGRAALRRARGPAGARAGVRRLLGLLRQQRLRLRARAQQPAHAAGHPDARLRRRRGRRLLPQPAAGARARARARARRRAALAALRLPAAAPPVRLARVRRAPQPPGLAVGPRQLPERLPELGQPQRLRVPQPGPRPPPAHLQPPLHLRRLRQEGASEDEDGDGDGEAAPGPGPGAGGAAGPSGPSPRLEGPGGEATKPGRPAHRALGLGLELCAGRGPTPPLSVFPRFCLLLLFFIIIIITKFHSLLRKKKTNELFVWMNKIFTTGQL